MLYASFSCTIRWQEALVSSLWNPFQKGFGNCQVWFWGAQVEIHPPQNLLQKARPISLGFYMEKVSSLFDMVLQKLLEKCSLICRGFIFQITIVIYWINSFLLVGCYMILKWNSDPCTLHFSMLCRNILRNFFQSLSLFRWM